MGPCLQPKSAFPAQAAWSYRSSKPIFTGCDALALQRPVISGRLHATNLSLLVVEILLGGSSPQHTPAGRGSRATRVDVVTQLKGCLQLFIPCIILSATTARRRTANRFSILQRYELPSQHASAVTEVNDLLSKQGYTW